MRIRKHTAALKAEIHGMKKMGKTIGLIPTMGTLHEGHLSLIRQSLSETDISVVTVFVNPTQFNDKTDLEKYPRNLKQDLEILGHILRKDDLVFTPGEKEIYPETDTRVFDFGQLDKSMEGLYRQGHFNGVVQVVSKLFYIVTPDNAYFGEKDYQQLTIIKQMVLQEKLPIEVVSCPIVREQDGLAMSSRNQQLSILQRKEATFIPKTLFRAIGKANHLEVNELKNWVIKNINARKLLDVEYFEIVDAKDLQPVRSWEEKKEIIGCIAVRIGEIRLIDNVKFQDI